MPLRRSTRIRAGACAVLLPVLVLAGTAGPVHAVQRCFPDPEGDLLFPDGEQGLDLVEFCIDHAPDVITFSVRAAAPFSAADVDQISVEVDLAGDRNADAFVNIVRGDDPTAGRLVAVLQTGQGQTSGLDVRHDGDELSVGVPAAELVGAGWRESGPYNVSVVTQTAQTGIDRIPNPWLTVEPVAAGGWSMSSVVAAVAAGLIVTGVVAFAMLRRRERMEDGAAAWPAGGDERAPGPDPSDDSDEDNETSTVKER